MNLNVCFIVIFSFGVLSSLSVLAQEKRLDAGIIHQSDFVAPQKRESKTIRYESRPVELFGLPVLDAWELRQTLSDGRLRSYKPDLMYEEPRPYDAFPMATHWCPNEEGRLSACREDYIRDPSGADVLRYTDDRGRILFERDPKRYNIEVPDTQIFVQVFYPNPVVALNEKYGNRLIDNDDQNSVWLDSALQIKGLRLMRDNSDIQAQTPAFRFKDLSNPVNRIPEVNGDSVLLTRDHPDFEHFNVLFHLEHFSEILTKKGYEELKGQLVFDSRALGGRDQSAFNPHHNPPALEFGLGGVDDGEDAQVVIHEYAHALCHWAAPHSNVGRERRMIEEGIADFLAMYYSQSLNPNFQNEVFSWDGHNEFWDGTRLNSKEKKSQTEQPSLISGRQIWSSCLKCIADQTNWEYASDLVLESLFYLRPELLMSELGSDLLFIDSMLQGGRNYHGMKKCLIQSGILFGDHRDIKPLEKQRYVLINSEGFAHKQQDAYLSFSEAYGFEFSVYDVSGRCVYRAESPYASHLRIPADIPVRGPITIHVILKNRNGDFIDALHLKLLKV